jgi:hypothetical protein
VISNRNRPPKVFTVAFSTYCAAFVEERNHGRGNCQNQKKVNVPMHGIGDRDSKKPQTQKDNGDCPKHRHYCLDHVLARPGVEPEVVILRVGHSPYNHRAFLPGVVSILSHRLFEGALHERDREGVGQNSNPFQENDLHLVFI